MKGIWIICAKEVKTLFTSPVFYIVSLLMTTMMSFNFYLALKNFSMSQGGPMYGGNTTNIHYEVFVRNLSVFNLILLFLLPALTMKLLAEERKLKTFDLLLTSPVTSLDIVLGKYLSALVAVAAWMGLAFLYPLSTLWVTDISWGPLLVSYLGLFLLAAVYAAISLFCSSLTEQSLIAFVSSVICNILLWFLGQGAEASDNQAVRSVFEHISVNTHLSALVYGTLRTNSLVFLLSMVALFVFLTERVVESFRWRSV